MIINEDTYGFDPYDRDGAMEFLLGGLDREAEAEHYETARRQADDERLEALKALEAIGTSSSPEQAGEAERAALAALLGISNDDEEAEQ